MAAPIERIVDAHIHLWDPANAEWYPYLAGQRELDMGDISGMCRLFDQPTYFAESSNWPVEKFVHVAAATAPHSGAETAHLQELADATGHPDAIVGGIVPGDPIADTERLLDQQMQSPRFRGIRPMGGEMGVPRAEVLRALADRDLIFELMVHPDLLESAAAELADFGDLTIVVEHAGWPRSDEPDERELWVRGIAALAALGDNVHCKLSGLAMPLHSNEASVLRPWIEHCLDAFGTDRCMFASNFPVDAMHGTYDELYGAYDGATSHLDAETRDKLFAANAERLYRC
ncbi:MAG TPA: amidohydrolase family protein [Acidimicrobiia bacterium]|nr:amidohydrolase family protein [Acidimicrobiia bacterium]